MHDVRRCDSCVVAGRVKNPGIAHFREVPFEGQDLEIPVEMQAQDVLVGEEERLQVMAQSLNGKLDQFRRQVLFLSPDPRYVQHQDAGIQAL